MCWLLLNRPKIRRLYEAVITRKGMKKTEVMVNGDGSVANLVAK